MRGDIIFQVYGLHGGRAEAVHFGAFKTEEEAKAEVAKLEEREMNGLNWAKQYHDKGFVIRKTVVDTNFEIPSLPAPRDTYALKVTSVLGAGGSSPSSHVAVFERGDAKDNLSLLFEYDRDYHLQNTFEPFRQNGRSYALVSHHYTRSTVIDVRTGAVIAEEANDGFCPVGFYVPDWWDVNNGSIIPGSDQWTLDHEWPMGADGFVWGCLWGDDSSWKVQHLDLRRIDRGVLLRDDRFGYIELASGAYEPAWKDLTRGRDRRAGPPSFIHVWRRLGRAHVRFQIELRFDLDTGNIDDLQLRCLNGDRKAQFDM
jgi:hypothetical protein